MGLDVPEILLPHAADLQKWAVIACDQFTQDYEYWEKVKSTAAGAPSALNLIFPEAYLSADGNEQRIADIHRAMKNYIDDGIFAAHRGCVYLERDTQFNKGRRGLVAALDLEQYDWKPQARQLIRCTEGTVPERLPPRMEIRRGAPLETPHILLLIDDDSGSLLPALGQRAKKSAPLYQTQLMMDSGSISGWLVNSEDDLAFLEQQLQQLLSRSMDRYAEGKTTSGESPFLFAVGDGNHSLASAKGIWEEYKKDNASNGLPIHPCRYALVEIENLYDPAIQFEPIHRVIFGLGLDETVSLLSGLPGFSSRTIKDRKELLKLCAQPCGGNRFGIVCADRNALVETSAAGISTAYLQPLLDRNLDASLIDYIHGEEELFRLACTQENLATGIILPPVKKSGFFETIARHGPLPRKSFSMGNASEKRFYMECRAI